MSPARTAPPSPKKGLHTLAPDTPGKHNILITGVTSTVGRKLAERLYYDSKVGKILGVAREERPYYFIDFAADRFLYKSANILKSRELNNLFLSDLFKKAEIDTVVHLAFINRTDVRSDEVHTLNVEGTKNLLDRCIETPSISKFIYKSSDVVYKLRPSNPVVLDENADLNFDAGADPWIKDRVDADMLCRAKMDHPRLRVAVLRFSNIIGRNIHSPLNSFFDAPFTFKAMGFDPLINLIHVNDVIQAVRLAIHKDVRGVFNVAGRDTAPISTFAELNRSRLFSMPEPVLAPLNWAQRKMGLTDYYYKVDADRMKFSCLLDTSKAKDILGFEPERHIKFG